jgi:uncharacterized iron-regulated protein
VIPDPLPGLAGRGVILLGEHHDRKADHAWQLRSIATLYKEEPSLVLGFEMFPRAAQLALDRWVAGELSEPAFLQQTDWKRVWGMDPALYWPIFRFARDHRVKMLALNVSGRLVHEVGKSGWAGVPETDREGIGTPAPPTAAYRAMLADAMSGHGSPAMSQESLGRFIDAQLLWDRAMAEAIVRQRMREPARPVVAIMGAGHLEHRDGVPHQLAALGVTDAAVLLQTDEACARPEAGVADAVHVASPASRGS